MFVPTVPRGHYYLEENGEEREVLNISRESTELLEGRSCFFCRDKMSEYGLLLYNKSYNKVFDVPTCGCELKNVSLEHANYQEWADALDLEGLPYFRVEPGPVLRLDHSEEMIQENMKNLPVQISGQIVDLTPAEPLEVGRQRNSAFLFPKHDVLLLITVMEERMDKVVLQTKIEMPDIDDLCKALTGSEDKVRIWVEELILHRATNRARVELSSRMKRWIGDALLDVLGLS